MAEKKTEALKLVHPSNKYKKSLFKDLDERKVAGLKS